MNLTEAIEILNKNGFLTESWEDFLPEPDPKAEKILNDCYDDDYARSWGPDSAYRRARERAKMVDADLDYPSNRPEFEEVYGYDIDDVPREVIDRLYPN